MLIHIYFLCFVCCFVSVDDETTIYGKIAELVAGWQIIQWYDGMHMLAQNKSETKLKEFFLELLQVTEGNVNILCRIDDLDFYRINFGYGNFEYSRDDIKKVEEYHNRRGNILPGAVIAVDTTIAKNNIEDIKAADRRIPFIRPGMAARIANRRNARGGNKSGNYGNNNNNYNNNNNNSNNSGSGRGNFRRIKFESSFSNATGVPPVPEIAKFNA